MQSFSDFPRRPSPVLAGAYKITHKASGKIYLGSTNDLSARRSRHLTDLRYSRHRNTHLQRLYNQDPVLEFFFVITENREEAYDYEQELLDFHWGSDTLLNMARNARAAFNNPSEESKLRHRLALRGLKRSDLTKERIRQAKLGVPRSDEMKEKLKAARTGTFASEETRAKMSAMRKGGKMPPRTKEHMDKIRIAKAGFKHSAESINKIRINAPNARSLSIDGVIYQSVAEAERHVGLSHRTIRSRLTNTNYPLWFYN